MILCRRYRRCTQFYIILLFDFISNFCTFIEVIDGTFERIHAHFGCLAAISQLALI